MNRQRYFGLVFVVFGVVMLGLVGWRPAVAEQGVSTALVPEHAVYDSGSERVSLRTVTEAMGRGDFAQARGQMEVLRSSDGWGPTVRSLEGFLSRYDRLAEQLAEAHKEAYQDYLDKMEQSAANARWRGAILEVSTGWELESEEKSKFEEELSEKIQEHWLDALVQLSQAHVLAEQVDIAERVDPNVHQEIVDHSLAIAGGFEEEEEWLEAYNRVYYFLTALDKTNQQYDDLQERLMRQAMITEMYAPDANQMGVSWQDHRQDVSFSIISAALAALKQGYVEEVNFQEMADRAFEYCLLLAETDKVGETFESLKDEGAVATYRGSIELLADIAETIREEEFGYYQLLMFLKKVMKINDETVGLPEEVIMAEFADGAFSALDGYSYIVWPGDVAQFRKEMTNEFSGVGIAINKKDGKLMVDSLLSKGAPAYKAGLDAGDVITHIDGQDTENITLEMAVKLITGRAGTEVVLTIDREGFEAPRDFPVMRGAVVVQTVKGLCRDGQGNWRYFLDPNEGIAYVRLTGFSGTTATNLRKIMEELRDQHMRALVLDLRYNSGGYLSGAIEVVDSFISKGVIVSSRYRPPNREDYPATREGTFDDDLPMVVLINGISASASEIVSGALKDYGRAVILGTRSFGKGNVQTIHELRPSGAQIKMSIAYYYLPSNRRVHRDPKDKADEDYGVEPDFKVALTGGQRQEQAKTQVSAGILHRDDLPSEARTWKVYAVDEVLADDLQLQMAKLCLQAQLLGRSLDEKGNQHVTLGPTGATNSAVR